MRDRIVKRPHDTAEGYHEPVWTGAELVADSLGRANNNGSIRWAVVRCNNTRCPLEVLVDPALLVQSSRTGWPA